MKTINKIVGKSKNQKLRTATYSKLALSRLAYLLM